MRKGRKILVTIACLAVLSALAALLLHEPEPQYHGRPLSAWLERARLGMNHPGRPALVAESREAVQQIGPNAIPHLLRWISYEPSGLRFQLGDSVCPAHGPASLLPLRRFLLAPGYKPGDAMIGFYLLGPAGRPAITRLTHLALSSSETTAVTCITALGTIGPDAIPALLTLVTNAQTARRIEAAIRCVGAQGTNAVAAVPQLQCLAGDVNTQVREAAREALLRIVPGAPTNAATRVSPPVGGQQ